jgi:hypothetical protein
VRSRFPPFSHAILSGRTGAHHITIDSPKYPEFTLKFPRTCHVFLPGKMYLSAMHGAGDATIASSRETMHTPEPMTGRSVSMYLKSLQSRHTRLRFVARWPGGTASSSRPHARLDGHVQAPIRGYCGRGCGPAPRLELLVARQCRRLRRPKSYSGRFPCSWPFLPLDRAGASRVWHPRSG